MLIRNRTLLILELCMKRGTVTRSFETPRLDDNKSIMVIRYKTLLILELCQVTDLDLNN